PSPFRTLSLHDALPICLTRRAHPVPEWILLYQNGSSTNKIAGQYHVGASTVGRHLRRRIPLIDRISASIIASTKYPKIPFSGDQDRKSTRLNSSHVAIS